MARIEGVGTGGITLYLFGGLASLSGQPARPASEFKIAVVGPAASFVLGTLFFGLDEALFYHTRYLAASQVFRHLGIVNWVLAGFNILPGMPLDGGRVLRAVVWQFNKNYREATRIAVRAGLTISLALIVYGALALKSDIVFALWSLIIGVLLATMLVSQTRAGGPGHKTLPGTVETVMSRDVVMVPPSLKVQDFIDNVLRNNRFTSFPVALEGRLHGLIVLEELKRVPSEEWPMLTAGEVMKPVNDSMFISTRASVAQARSLLSTNGIGRAAGLDEGGSVVGYISKSDLERG